jgi:dTDP-4-amino-4,6-dideoxygalactose transaminase
LKTLALLGGPIRSSFEADVFKAMRASDRALGFSLGEFPNAERYYAGAMSLPIFSAMTENEQNCVIEALASALV